MAASNSYRKSSVAPVGAAIDTCGRSSSTTVSSTAGPVTAASLGVAVSSIVTSPSSTSLSTASTVSVADADAALAAKVNVAPSGNAIRSAFDSAASVTVNGMSWTGATVAVTVTVSPSSRSSSDDSVSVTDGPSVMVAVPISSPDLSAIRASVPAGSDSVTVKSWEFSVTMSSVVWTDTLPVQRPPPGVPDTASNVSSATGPSNAV